MRLLNLANLQQFTAVNLTADQGYIGGPVQIPSCARIVLYWSLSDGKTAHNVLIGQYNGAFAGTGAQATAILQALIAGATWSALAAFMPTTGQLSGLTIQDVNTINNPEIANSTPAPGPGTSSGSALPDEVALVVTLRTAKTGTQNRGRVFVPNWATNALGAGNTVAAGAVTALGNWATSNLLSALQTNGYTPVIGHRARAAYTGISGTQHPARPAGSVPITQAVVRDNHWDSQRKRGLR